MLTLTNITYRYEKEPLLRDVSFSLGAHELLCLLGSSGSGKSTLLRLIAGLEKPESGVIAWADKDLAALAPHQRNFGLMFQDYALFPHRSVYENVAFGLRMQSMGSSEIRERVSECLSQVDMTAFADRKVTELSGGEQQRIALARALAPRPRLLMLDEPLGALDHSLRQSLMEELRNVLGANGIPTIYVTHDQEEAFALADKIALLHEGKILQMDTPDRIYRYPQSEWAAGFLGLKNILPGESDGNGNIVIRLESQLLSFPDRSGYRLIKGEHVSVLFQNGSLHELFENTPYSLSGSVLESVFRGLDYEIRVRIGEKYQFALHYPNAVQKGIQVQIRYQPDDFHCFLVKSANTTCRSAGTEERRAR